MSGKVFLVGAGPGDPDLLTAKAIRILRTAEIVLHDALVGQQVLDLIPVSAHVENVGKRGGGKHCPQHLINRRIVHFASLGKCVVRLQGGDPMLFGRAGEEIHALREAAIDFEVIPGVTAALAASAAGRFPLTDRTVASSVLFLTGHSCAGNATIDWRAAVSTRATLVVYMPGDHRILARNILRDGVAPTLPTALISHLSSPQQKIVSYSLLELATAPPAGSPSLLVIGDVVRHAQATTRLPQESVATRVATEAMYAALRWGANVYPRPSE